MQIFDAHLDLAYNAVRGRRVDLPAGQQTADEEGIPTVGLPDLKRGGVSPICATIFCQPAERDKAGYRNGDEAHAQAQQQLAWYRQQQEVGAMRFIGDPSSLAATDDPATAAILLLEGADAIGDESDLETFFTAGLRIVGLAWKQTRYAGGTGAPGPLSSDGVRLVKSLDRLGIIHDVSHLAEESFWQLLDQTTGPVIASHSNCRAIVPTDRQLSDAMIRAIASRGGVIGINFYDKFLLPPEDYGKRRATLVDVVAHIRHICHCVGSAAHVGLGTDMDGGLGREEIPLEIQTSTDLHRLVEALARENFPPRDVRATMAENWRRFFAVHLAGRV